MADHFAKISVIIPVRMDEEGLQRLLPQLEGLGCEILICCEGSRAKSMNAGAKKAQHEYLWFLHADTYLTVGAHRNLQHALEETPDALHYFSIAFLNDGPLLCHLNAMVANWRSRIFGLPLGDQGFCIRKDLFEEIGGFPEDVSYGEDHLFVWKAKAQKVKIRSVPAKIFTSARTYRKHGWLKVTAIYQGRLLWQATQHFLHKIGLT